MAKTEKSSKRRKTSETSEVKVKSTKTELDDQIDNDNVDQEETSSGKEKDKKKDKKDKKKDKEDKIKKKSEKKEKKKKKQPKNDSESSESGDDTQTEEEKQKIAREKKKAQKKRAKERKKAEKEEEEQATTTNAIDENPYLLTKKEGAFEESTTVFIGQLPKAITSNEIRALFPSFPISRIKIMKFKDTNKPMGSAFVEFHSEESAIKATERNGEEYQGRRLKINFSGNKPSKSTTVDTNRDRDQRLIYVGNLNFKTEKPAIIRLFKKCGKVERVDMPMWKDSGKKRGFAVVEFADTRSVTTAIATMHDTELDGRKLVVQIVSDNRGTKTAGFKRSREEAKKN